MFMQFLTALHHYSVEVFPALALGFLISGIVHEFVPTNWVEKYLGSKGIRPILYSTLIGTLLPICCWGSLPVALSFDKKGSRMGPVIAFLVATPATSISALIVSYKLLGPTFTLYIFFSVILMGLIIGILGNLFTPKPREQAQEECPECGGGDNCCQHNKTPAKRIRSILKFAFLDMPKEIGLEIVAGLMLAAAVAAFVPIGKFVGFYLGGAAAYPFSVIFGLLMYICSTASVPLVDALLNQGMNVGAGLVLLLVGPVTSYGTILVLRKEFGTKLLIFYISSICILALILGFVYSLLQ